MTSNLLALERQNGRAKHQQIKWIHKPVTDRVTELRVLIQHVHNPFQSNTLPKVRAGLHFESKVINDYDLLTSKAVIFSTMCMSTVLASVAMAFEYTLLGKTFPHTLCRCFS